VSLTILFRSRSTGSQVLGNPGFDTDTVWTKGSGVTIGSGIAFASSSSQIVGQSALVAGQTYNVSFEYNSGTNNGAKLRLNNSNINEANVKFVSGALTFDSTWRVVTATIVADGPWLWVEADSNVYIGGIDNFTATAVSTGASVYTAPVSGGLQTGGASAVSRLAVKVYVASGGVQTGGSAGLARVVVRTVTLTGGSIQTGGTAPRALIQDVAPLGGIQIGGTAPVSRVRASQASGGILTGGTVLKALTKSPAASGGLLTGGSALTSLQGSSGATTYAYFATGGFVLGGTAATSGPAGIVSGGIRSRIQYLETLRSFEEPKRKAGKPSGELVDEFLGRGHAYKGGGEVKVGAVSKARRGSAVTAFVSAASLEARAATAETAASLAGSASQAPAVTFEAIGSGLITMGGEAVTYRHDPFLLARFEDLDLLMMG
jgi:hypothetical protein